MPDYANLSINLAIDENGEHLKICMKASCHWLKEVFHGYVFVNAGRIIMFVDIENK